jgi:alkaline phosphatase
MHDLGTTHEKITEDIKQINDEVEAMCDELADTLVIVTADHGLVDTEWRFITDYPEIEICLLRNQSIESRAMTFFIKDGMNAQFETAFSKYFKDCYMLMSRQEVLDTHLFGNGAPHQRSLGFIGDYLAIAKGNISIECNKSAEHDSVKAAHAGMTVDEMNVPFIVVECGKGK